MKIFIAVLIDVLSILYILKISDLGYNLLELINGIIFTFSFGFGIPVILSGVLTIIILISPGVIVYFLWDYLTELFRKK